MRVATSTAGPRRIRSAWLTAGSPSPPARRTPAVLSSGRVRIDRALRRAAGGREQLQAGRARRRPAPPGRRPTARTAGSRAARPSRSAARPVSGLIASSTALAPLAGDRVGRARGSASRSPARSGRRPAIGGRVLRDRRARRASGPRRRSRAARRPGGRRRWRAAGRSVAPRSRSQSTHASVSARAGAAPAGSRQHAERADPARVAEARAAGAADDPAQAPDRDQDAAGRLLPGPADQPARRAGRSPPPRGRGRPGAARPPARGGPRRRSASSPRSGGSDGRRRVVHDAVAHDGVAAAAEGAADMKSSEMIRPRMPTISRMRADRGELDALRHPRSRPTSGSRRRR